jgi:phytoene dehydrogenase-like protein
MAARLMGDSSVVIVGGGHNGLTAAAYLARSGVKVTVLEQLGNFGGAAISAQAFEGVDARLSRYSYLVSLLPKQVIEDLELRIELAPRRYSSYTPVPGDSGGLLVDNQDSAASAESFANLGAASDAEAWQQFYGQTQALARVLWPEVTHPLRTRSEVRAAVHEATGSDQVWQEFMEHPVGRVIGERFQNDLVRGVVYTDALIGTFASNDDESLSANRCFLYHVIGGGTGDWNVPLGGMGAVSGELERAAREAGAQLISGADVLEVTGEGTRRVVRYSVDGRESKLEADFVLVNASRQELSKLTAGNRALDTASDIPADNAAAAADTAAAPAHPGTPAAAAKPYPFGAQVKVNLLLSRLPKLKDPNVTPEQAFGGTFHINETWSQLQSAFEKAARGEVPDPMPCEIYCHSLTDPSILGPELRASGAHTLTVFALHAPHSLVEKLSENEHEVMRNQLERAVLTSLNSVLAEPIEPLLMTDARGKPCVETKTTRDLEAALRLPGGNIFHEPLSWPFVEDDAPMETPAQRWGVATADERVLLCGSAAQRGGAVSGIAGHNAAMAVLEMLSEAAR